MSSFIALACVVVVLGAYRLWDAVPVLRMRAEHGGIAAAHKLGLIYSTPDTVRKTDAALSRYAGLPFDEALANAWFLQAAKAGDAASQYDIGVSYAAGAGVKKDAAQAAEWFKKAAAQNYAPAELSVGLCYLYGTGVPQDAHYAALMIESAMRHGDADATYQLANLYLTGSGVKKSYSKARKLFEEFLAKNAKGNTGAAARQLGMMHLMGQGVTADAETAARYFWQGAQSGDAQAQFQLARLLMAGDGVARNDALARSLLEKAKAQGDRQAQDMLAHIDGFNRQIEASKARAALKQP